MFSLGGSTDDLGDDLTELLKEVRTAPTNLGSFAQSRPSSLNDEVRFLLVIVIDIKKCIL